MTLGLKEVFEHNQKMIFEVVNYLRVDKIKVTEIYRLGSFTSMASGPWQKVVKFQTIYHDDKPLARASISKNDPPGLNDIADKVYIANSLNRELQLLEQNS